jgi:hypothetical protein
MKLKLGVSPDGQAVCAHCGLLLDGVTTHKEIEVDESVVVAEKEQEKASREQNDRALRHMALGLLLGASGGAILALVLQVPVSPRMLIGIGIGTFVGVIYWVLADVFDPGGAAEAARGIPVGNVRVHNEFTLLAVPLVVVGLLRTLFGNLHAGLMLPLLGTVLGTLVVAGWLGGTATTMLATFAAVLCGFIGAVAGMLLGPSPEPTESE